MSTTLRHSALMRTILPVVACILGSLTVKGNKRNEYKEFPGTVRNNFSSPLPKSYVNPKSIPKDFFWGNVKGKSYMTRHLNQHLPRYCGSCWAHAAFSCLADRIKIAKGLDGPEIGLSIQYVLNCGSWMAGSCNGGSQFGAYMFIKSKGFIPFETCQPYQACSSDVCKGDFECSDMNICRTCIGPSSGALSPSECHPISDFPKASIKEYGEVSGEEDMMAEIYARGPIACNTASDPIDDYKGGIFNSTTDAMIDHVTSVVGWGEEDGLKYWIVRNSWGEYWGEMGFFRVARGRNLLMIETSCAWAVPESWTTHNGHACWINGSNCKPTKGEYRDPSLTRKPWGAVRSEESTCEKAEPEPPKPFYM